MPFLGGFCVLSVLCYLCITVLPLRGSYINPGCFLFGWATKIKMERFRKYFALKTKENFMKQQLMLYGKLLHYLAKRPILNAHEDL